MQYKVSGFNIIIRPSENEKVFYNTYTKVPVRAAANNEKLIEEMIKNREIPKEFSDECLEKLRTAGIIVPEDKNEYALIDYEFNKVLYSERRLEFTILPTDGCNFNCIYCYQKEPFHKMSDEVVNRFLTYIDRNVKRYDKLIINWFGGEPLLEKEKVKYMMREISRICKRDKVLFAGKITTNGSKLDLDTFNELVRNHVFSYQITIDGTREIHNYQRPLRNGGDSYEMIMNNLKNIRDNAASKLFRIILRLNVTKQILDNADEIVDIYKKEFAGDPRFIYSWEPVQDWGGDKIDQVKEDMIYDYSEYFEKMNQAYHQNVDFLIDFASDKDSQVCLAAKRNGFVLDYDGSLYKCTMALYDEDPKIRAANKVGYINEYGEIKTDESNIATWLRDNRTEKCKECAYYPLCNGAKCPYAVNFKGVGSCYKINYFKTMTEKQAIMKIERDKKAGKDEGIYI